VCIGNNAGLHLVVCSVLLATGNLLASCDLLPTGNLLTSSYLCATRNLLPTCYLLPAGFKLLLTTSGHQSS
jgi:hypothetical protein